MARGGRRHPAQDRPYTGPESCGWGEARRPAGQGGGEETKAEVETNRGRDKWASCHLHPGHWEMVELLSLVFS